MSPGLVVHLALIAVRESRPVTVESVNVFFALADAGVRQTLRVVVQTTGLRTVTHSATNITHTNSHTKGSPYSITERRVLELIPVLGSQPAGDVSHKPGGRLPLGLLSARPTVILATLERDAINFYRAMLCIRGTSHGPVSVCLSVCPSVRHKSVFY